MSDQRTCAECGNEPRDHLRNGMCCNCYRRVLRAAGRLKDDNARVGRRAEQKRRWDREAAQRKREERAA